MGDVIDLPVVTRLDLDPDLVLTRAIGECETAVVLGYDKDGAEYFASSTADGRTVLWLIERLKKQLLED